MVPRTHGPSTGLRAQTLAHGHTTDCVRRTPGARRGGELMHRGGEISTDSHEDHSICTRTPDLSQTAQGPKRSSPGPEGPGEPLTHCCSAWHAGCGADQP